jgi:glycine cleavage system H protein
MSSIPEGLRYTQSHEWIRDEGDGVVAVGITDFAQSQLGDIVFVEVPQAAADVTAGEVVGVVESVKAASDLYSPVSGTIEASNGELETGPERVNEDPYAAWFVKVRLADPAQLNDLLSAAAYADLLPADQR